MGIVPDDRLARVAFYEAHISPWAASPPAIGLTAGQVTNLSTLTKAARNAYDLAEIARNRSKAATQAFYDAVRAMHNGPNAGSDMIEAIKNFASTTNNPNVFVLANIPAPARPGTLPPPGTSFGFTVNLLQSGAVQLKWKCNNPAGTSGTLYEVRRASTVAPSASDFVFIGASGSKSFLDETLQRGAAPATYQITAVRSTSRGNPAQFTVNFGIGGDGQAKITVQTEPATPIKIAA
jgi:hypothetical protein